MENLCSISECHDISFCNLDELNTNLSYYVLLFSFFFI